MNGRRVDHAGLQVLDQHECLQLMAGVPIGRLIFNEDGLPAVHPVSFVLEEQSVVFCTSDERKAKAAERNDIVGFQVDAFDINTYVGWTVTAIGHLSPVTDPAARRLPVRPWTSDHLTTYIRLSLEVTHGRRILPNPRTTQGPAQSFNW